MNGSNSKGRKRHTRLSDERELTTMFDELGDEVIETQERRTEPTSAKRHAEHRSPRVRVNGVNLNGFALCDGCRGLNLPDLMRSFTDFDESGMPDPWSNYWPSVVQVGNRYRDLADSTCTLCPILFASRIESGKGPLTEEGFSKAKGMGEELAAITFPRPRPHSSPWVGPPLSVGLVICPKGFSKSASRDLGRHAMSKGCATIVMDTDMMKPPMFTPRLIPRLFDPYFIKPWLDHCFTWHRPSCGMKPLPVRGVNVIDCATLTIDKCDANTPYVALSYVWGSTGTIPEGSRMLNGSKLLPRKLSAVIRDSIEVTKALGFRYLWVDRYCIDQDRPDLKHDQIRQMDAIYRNAELTIIGAAGVDETHGLPGVGSRARSPQLYTEIGNITAMWSPKDPQIAIAQSHWSTRGWTFQEAFLSRRRLVFTDDQVYFECNVMHCYEGAHDSFDKLIVHGGFSTIPFGPRMFGKSQVQQYSVLSRDDPYQDDTFRAYISAVEEYTARGLRFDEDSINAFRGILRDFANQDDPLDEVWGMCYSRRGGNPYRYFSYALTWIHKDNGKPPRPRTEFPSWTWAGWAGQVEYSLSSASRRIDYMNDLNTREFGFLDSDLHFVDLANVTLEGRYPILHIKAAMVRLAPNAYNAQNRKIPWVVKFGMKAKTKKFGASLSWSADAEAHAMFLESYTDRKRWNCIFIGSVLNVSFVMVLEARPKTRTWQRVGMFSVPVYYSDIGPHLYWEQYRAYDIV